MEKLSDHLYIPPMGKVLEERREAERAAYKTKLVREFAAARISRQNADWITTPTTANWEIYASLRRLRTRSRQMFRDVSHFRKYQTMCVSNVIGRQGLRLQCRAYRPDGKTLDRKLNKQIEAAFWEWGFKENCSASGKINWLGFQKILMRQLPRDGEVLFQKVRARNKFGFALKEIDVNWLDETYNVTLASGNRIIMSVEVDPHYRPVRYWLTEPNTELVPTGQPRRYPIDASEIVHIYDHSEDESQTRGIPWAHAAMMDAKNLHGYKDGVITSARMAAMSFGFLKRTAAEEVEFLGETDPETGKPKDISIDASPASFSMLPDGYEMQQFDPKQPTQNHEMFYKSMLRDEAAGLDVNYFSLLGDYAEVNLSSGRLGLNEERDVWRSLQTFVGEHFCREVYHEWLKAAWLSGAINITPRQYEELQNPSWRGRGWDYMDPAKEIAANVQALQNKLTTWTSLYAEKGLDFIDVLEEMQAEEELAAEFGIDLKAITSVTVKDTGSAPTDDSGDGSETPPAGKRELANGHDLVMLDGDEM